MNGFVSEWEHDILAAIDIPFVDTTTQYFDMGDDGFPAVGLRPGSDVKKPARMHLPDKLSAEFSLLATIRPMTDAGGFLFAVVNPLETVVQLGLEIAAAGPDAPGHTNISLLYTDVNSYAATQCVAAFVVPSFTGKWARIALAVKAEEVELYFNCELAEKVSVVRRPAELVFDSASTLYVGQAGPIIKGVYDVSITLAPPSRPPN